jgi:hypothetical protein
MSEEITNTPAAPQEATTNPAPEQEAITVDMATAFNLKVQEFDMKIAEAEAMTSDLKRQRAAYIYDTNLQNILKASKQAPETPQAVQS